MRQEVPRRAGQSQPCRPPLDWGPPRSRTGQLLKVVASLSLVSPGMDLLVAHSTSVEKMLTHGSFVYETQSRSLPLYVMSLDMGDGSAPGHGCHFDGFQGVPLCDVSSGYGQFRGWLWVIEGSISDHGVQGQDTAVGQGEND